MYTYRPVETGGTGEGGAAAPPPQIFANVYFSWIEKSSF